MHRYVEKWRREPWRLWLTLYGLGILACGGPATPRTPGGGTPLDPDPGAHTLGPIAVEPDESAVWFVHQGTSPSTGESKSFLTAVDSHNGAVQDVIDVTGYVDRWLLFPSPSSALLLAQDSLGENLYRIETGSRTVVATQDYPTAQFRDPRASPSGGFVSVVADSSGRPQIAAIDSATLLPATIMTASLPFSSMEAGWAHLHEWLVGVEGTLPGSSGGGARIDLWQFATGVVPAAPSFEISFQALCMTPDVRNVAISPDDHWAVVTLADCNGGDPLVVIDLNDGTYRLSSAQGPVSWTPDSTTIVSHDFTDGNHPMLQLLPVDTLVPQRIEVPGATLFDYFVTPGGNWIVCSSSLSGEIALYDATNGHVTTLANSSGVYLDEFVVRPGFPELWIASSQSLWRLDLPTSELEKFVLGFSVRHLNVLPSQDALVLSAPEGGTLRFLHMSDRAVYRTVQVPSPVPLVVAVRY